MFGKIFGSFFGKKKDKVGGEKQRGSRHHRRAVSDGLRRGSSDSGRVMANWRWKKKKK